MPPPTDDPAEGPTDEQLRQLLDAEEHRHQVARRQQRRELRRQAQEALQLIDVLATLAGAGAAVEVQTSARVLGPSAIVEVGRDYVALRADDAVDLIPIAAVTAVQAVGTAPRLAPSPGITLDLAERLAELAALRPEVAVDTGRTTVGRLRQAGRHLLVVEAAAGPGTGTYVAVEALVAVTLRAERQSSASPPLSPEPTTSG